MISFSTRASSGRARCARSSSWSWQDDQDCDGARGRSEGQLAHGLHVAVQAAELTRAAFAGIQLNHVYHSKGLVGAYVELKKSVSR